MCRIIRRNTLSGIFSRFPMNIYIEWMALYRHTLYIYISMVLEILLNMYRDLFKHYLNTSTKYILMIKSFFWTKPYEPGSIITQLTMLLSVVFIAIFGKSYIVYFLFLQYPFIVVEKWTYYYCREITQKASLLWELMGILRLCS